MSGQAFAATYYFEDETTPVLCLPIPNVACSPNARRGQSKWAAMRKARIVKGHRETARMIAISALNGVQKRPEFAGYSMAFFFRTKAYRDDDNADASCKSYRDGIAEALGMNDRDLKKLALSTFGKDPVFPRVEIKLIPKP